MEFAVHRDPWDESDCEMGPWGLLQPKNSAETVVPEVLFVPLLAFTEEGARLGQGGGHYDRWLEKYPDTTAMGLAWDVQRVDDLPLEVHDRRLAAVVTPTRMYGPFV
jgi:5-formyltetrahydrofolate cyclo-ligase